MRRAGQRPLEDGWRCGAEFCRVASRAWLAARSRSWIPGTGLSPWSAAIISGSASAYRFCAARAAPSRLCVCAIRQSPGGYSFSRALSAARSEDSVAAASPRAMRTRARLAMKPSMRGWSLPSCGSEMCKDCSEGSALPRAGRRHSSATARLLSAWAYSSPSGPEHASIDVSRFPKQRLASRCVAL